jgi:hypothetical protein
MSAATLCVWFYVLLAPDPCRACWHLQETDSTISQHTVEWLLPPRGRCSPVLLAPGAYMACLHLQGICSTSSVQSGYMLAATLCALFSCAASTRSLYGRLYMACLHLQRKDSRCSQHAVNWLLPPGVRCSPALLAPGPCRACLRLQGNNKRKMQYEHVMATWCAVIACVGSIRSL